jgi:hypothetical protein
VHNLPEGEQIRYYEARPAVVDSRLQPLKDASGNVSLGDTLVTSAEGSGELTRSMESGFNKQVGGCEDPTQRYCDEGGVVYRLAHAVYWVLAVHTGVVYNVAVAMVWGKYVAVWTPKKSWTADTGLLRDQIVNSIATQLRI